jgi:hypothetical protein
MRDTKERKVPEAWLWVPKATLLGGEGRPEVCAPCAGQDAFAQTRNHGTTTHVGMGGHVALATWIDKVDVSRNKGNEVVKECSRIDEDGWAWQAVQAST